jgi:hypothetical protein
MSFRTGTLFSKLISTALIVTTAGAMAQRHGGGRDHDNPRDQPYWVRGQLVSNRVQLQPETRGFEISVLDALNLRRGEVRSVYIVAASRNGTETVRLNLNRNSVGTFALHSNLELIEIPVGRMVSRNLDNLFLSGRGTVYIEEIGALVDRADIGDDDPNTPPPHSALLEFQGSYEQVDVAFEGRTRAEVNGACMQYMNGRNFNFVDEVKVFGTPAKLSGYLTPATFCAWAGLNARFPRREEAPVKTNLVFEGLPIQIRMESYRDLVELKADIESLAPAIQMNFVDDLSRDDAAYKLNGYLNQNGMKAFLLGNLPLTGSRLKAVGQVEKFPVRFEGETREEIRRDCLNVMGLAALNFVDETEINGHSNRSSHYLDVQEVCMIVSTNAQ